MLKKLDKFAPVLLLGLLAAIAVWAYLAPQDINLGANLRLILLHGAWVWSALILFVLAAVAALCWLVIKRADCYRTSLAIALVALLFWILYLPQSMMVMKANWGGFYFSEPRWQIPFSFAVIGVLLAVGLYLIRHPLATAFAIIAYAATLVYNLLGITSVLHPDSPVGASSSFNIKGYFGVMMALITLLGLVLARQGYLRLRNLQE